MNLFDLTGKKSVVTGGSRGLGRGIAEGLHEAGAEVVIIGSSDEVFTTAEEMNKTGSKVYAVKGDLGDRGQITDIFNQAIGILGTVDILVNNAGIQSLHKSEEFPLDVWDKVLQINLTTTFQLCQLAGKIMLERGSGKIINVASMNCFVTAQKIIAYVASKSAVGQITKALANEWGGRGVNINAIAPGYFDTTLTSFIHQDSEREKLIESRIPMERWGTPNDLKGAAIFLASDASAYVNGIVLPVDGGYLSR
ncbi:MAG: glucose 1-dehydrogenase [Peptostreptococcaceae bacterium]|nr:glucose 1-dehydrogenase [Peptostreptococcaceae bacterium]